MLETSARLLRLLGLLQMRRDWTGPQLAERLEVTTRTVRHDVERLRSLGYPVHGTRGVTGGYRLGAGAALPPLLLDDDEAVAIAVGLRAAAGGGVGGFEETSLRALAKLEQVLPARLRQRVSTLIATTVAIPSDTPKVASEVLLAISRAVDASEQMRLDYVDFNGATSRRTVEPHWIAHTRGRWYLVAWDVDREAWRTFRVDRIQPRSSGGRRFTPRHPPQGGVVAYLQKQLSAAVWHYRAQVKVLAPATEMVARMPPEAVVEPLDARTCLVAVGSDSPGMLAVWLGMLGADFELLNAPELVQHMRVLSRRYARAARSHSSGRVNATSSKR